jgi:sigma-B regulation protein RsbU (phosphoserine phosphatase)
MSSKPVSDLSELRTSTALESIGEAVIITDQKGTIQYVNSAFETITGYSREEVVGVNPRVLRSGSHNRFFYQKLWRTISKGKVWSGSFIDKKKDGSLYDTDTTIAPLRDPANSIIGYIAVSRDVTERKRAETALRESEVQMRSIVEAAENGIITINEEGIIESFNPAVRKQFGYLNENLTGELISKLILPPSPKENSKFSFPEMLKNRRSQSSGCRELVGVRRDGTQFPVELTISEFRIGKHKLYTGIICDLTERSARIEAEQQLLIHKQEFRVAREIQQRFYPVVPPSLTNFDIYGFSSSAEAAGGDYYDYLPMQDGCLGIVIGDVSGHGIGSALIMSQTRAYLHALIQMNTSLTNTLRHLNNYLTGDFSKEQFVTLCLARLDSSNMTLHYASAGHQSYLLRSSGDLEVLTATEIPLGILPERYPKSRSVQLAPGDILVFITDGIEETFSPDEEEFGQERAIEYIFQHREESAEQIARGIYDTARDFAEGAPQKDDMTTVIVKVR